MHIWCSRPATEVLKHLEVKRLYFVESRHWLLRRNACQFSTPGMCTMLRAGCEAMPKPESDLLLFEMRHFWFLPDAGCKSHDTVQLNPGSDDFADERSSIEGITEITEARSGDEFPLATKSLVLYDTSSKLVTHHTMASMAPAFSGIWCDLETAPSHPRLPECRVSMG